MVTPANISFGGGYKGRKVNGCGSSFKRKEMRGDEVGDWGI
jgi:hypothetical protein